jgi:hypothetical protein
MNANFQVIPENINYYKNDLVNDDVTDVYETLKLFQSIRLFPTVHKLQRPSSTFPQNNPYNLLALPSICYRLSFFSTPETILKTRGFSPLESPHTMESYAVSLL